MFYPDLMVDIETSGVDSGRNAILQLAAVPFLCMAGALLCEADDGFSLLMDEWGNRLRPDFGPDFWVQAWLLAASLPVGAYLYGLVAGTARAGGPVRTMGRRGGG